MAEDPRDPHPRPPAQALDRRIFVVEVWREAGSFRAAARDVAQEQARCFDEPAGLAAYLSTGLSDAAAGAPSQR